MNEVINIKVIGYLFLIPVVFMVPLLSIYWVINKWQKATENSRDTISWIVFIILSVLCLFKMVMDANDKGTQSICAGLIWAISGLHFGWIELRRQGGWKAKSLSGQKSEFLRLGFLGAWKTRYHAWSIVQIALIIYAFYHSF